jgi:hypothetical protein
LYQTIPTYIWVIMGVLGAALLAIVIGLTADAALQANNAMTSPRSIIDQPGASFALDSNWIIYRSIAPAPIADWNTVGSANLPATINPLLLRGASPGKYLSSASSKADVYGAFPSNYYWDPSDDFLFPTRESAVRIEIVFGTFTALAGQSSPVQSSPVQSSSPCPAFLTLLDFFVRHPPPGGGSGVVKVRLITPRHWFNPPAAVKQITPKIIATCTVGGHVIATTVNPSAASPYYTDYTFNTADPFIWSNGTNNQYPFDTYAAPTRSCRRRP